MAQPAITQSPERPSLTVEQSEETLSCSFFKSTGKPIEVHFEEDRGRKVPETAFCVFDHVKKVPDPADDNGLSVAIAKIDRFLKPEWQTLVVSGHIDEGEDESGLRLNLVSGNAVVSSFTLKGYISGMLSVRLAGGEGGYITDYIGTFFRKVRADWAAQCGYPANYPWADEIIIGENGQLEITIWPCQ